MDKDKDDEILERLHSITDKEWKEIVNNLTKWVYFKLKGKTLFGAHSEQELGMYPANYYVDEAIGKLFSLEWKWHFDKYPILEQLQLIAGSMISENVRKFKTKKGTIIPTEEEDLIYLIEKNSYAEYDDEIYQIFLVTLSACSNDDEELELYSAAILTCNSFDEISDELGWDKEKLYKLQRKLQRRMIKYLEKRDN
jgi:hypothetical protein